MAEMLGQFLAAASADRDQWPPSAIEDCVEFGESYRRLVYVHEFSARCFHVVTERASDRIYMVMLTSHGSWIGHRMHEQRELRDRSEAKCVTRSPLIERTH